jgi:hypothetical protein
MERIEEDVTIKFSSSHAQINQMTIKCEPERVTKELGIMSKDVIYDKAEITYAGKTFFLQKSFFLQRGQPSSQWLEEELYKTLGLSLNIDVESDKNKSK